MKKKKLLQKMAICSALMVCFTCGLFLYGKKASLLQEGQVDYEEKPGMGKEDGGKPSGAPDAVTPMPVIPVVPVKEPPFPVEGVWGTIYGAGESETMSGLSGNARTIIIQKKENGYENAIIELDELPVERQIRLSIHGVQEEIEAGQVFRISEGTLCQGMPPTPTPTPTEIPTPTGTEADQVNDGILGDNGILGNTGMLENTGALGNTGMPEASPTPTPTPAVTPTMSPEDPLYKWRFDPVKGIEINTVQQDDGSLDTTLLITLDKTYVYQIYEDEWNYYISLLRPKDVYPKIVVIDAGHGGLDIGTYSEGYAHYEKTVCLNVLLYLKELLDAQDDIKVYYTRTTDWKPSLMQRVNLANDVEADFFLSVHCNGSESKSLNGTEVLYSAAQNSWEGMNSKQFAQICLDKLVACMGLKNRGLVPRDHNVTIIQQAKMPVALVELAFMSNASDMKVLEKEETQRNIAKVLYEAILETYERMEEIGVGNELAE